MSSPFLEAARTWAAQDPDPKTRAELEAAIARGDGERLARAFATPLEFGTAGLRGPVGPGPACMNLALVLRVSHALSLFLKERGLGVRPILLGFDGRRESAGFARAAASVHRAHGFSTWVFDRPGPTPWVAFGARFLGAAAGIAVTPSHNPRGDAGYKLYDDVGIQLVNPWDTRIAELLREAPPADRIPREESGILSPPKALLEAYEAWTRSLGSCVLQGASGDGSGRGEARVSVAYTALHGVGEESARRAARPLGVELVSVAEQSEIDGDFPTTPFPNPEEPGTLDLLFALMQAEKLDLGYANDPDVDRFAAVVSSESTEGPRSLSGDALGLLLGDIWLEALAEGGVRGEVSPLVVSTVVSSPGLDRLAQKWGARVARTLTGFKWLCRPALTDAGFVFAYEEALGSCFAFPEKKALLDKDGIAALSVLSSFVRREWLRDSRRSPGEIIAARRARLAREIGLWTSRGTSLRLDGGASAGAELVLRIRREPPDSFGARRVLGVTDYHLGAELRPDYLGQQDLLVFELEGGGRLCVRPSGTEPKLKLYAHGVAELDAEPNFAQKERRLEAELDALLLDASARLSAR